jgi:iron(III) transport system substrate-binding protein
VDPFEAEWAELVAAAQAEGELEAFMSGAVGRGLPPRIGVFEDRYGIPVTISSGSSRNQVEKVRAERDAGRFTLDIWIGGAGTANRSLLPGGMIDPLKPILIHPEVLDKSAWYTGDLAWTDLETQQSILSFGADGSTARIAYNTELVDPDELESFWDLLEPKWHGQIVAATDPRGTGTGTNTVFFYDNPDLGPEFLTRLLTETDITLAADAVQAVNWLATGRFAICLFGCDDEAEEASEQGLPVQPQWPTVLKEGAMANVGGANIMLVNQAPHPRAAQLFINWWLSKEGQSLMQEVSGIDSLRTDIPKDTVASSNLRVEGYPNLKPILENDTEVSDPEGPLADLLVNAWENRLRLDLGIQPAPPTSLQAPENLPSSGEATASMLMGGFIMRAFRGSREKKDPTKYDRRKL